MLPGSSAACPDDHLPDGPTIRTLDGSANVIDMEDTNDVHEEVVSRPGKFRIWRRARGRG